MTDTQTKILVDRRTVKLPAIADLVKKAAAREGIGAGRVMREMFRLAVRRGGLTQREYFAYHLYRKSLSWDQKREFIGEMESYRLNLRLSPPGLTRMRGFLNDKITHTALWRAWGIPTTRTQAMFSRDRWLGPVPTLRDRDAVVDFLKGDAVYPLFGKPVEGLQSLGAVYIEAVDVAAGTATLLTGRTVGIEALADEIVREFPDGYMFQDAEPQHPEISELLGPALSCPRLVTIIEDDRPTVLYAYWKIAAYNGVSDNFWQKDTMLAKIDVATGTVTNCITGKGPDETQVETHPVSGKPVLGYRIPFWAEAVEMVQNAHAIFPINGCLGWDVAFGPKGPVLIECNDNTGHDTYQLVAGHGALHPSLKERFDRVIARNKRIAADRKARVYKVET